MKDGSVLQKLVHDSPGEPANQRFGIKEILEKYNKCMDFVGTYSADEMSGIADQLLELDKIKDLSNLLHRLTFPRNLAA